MNTNCPRCNSMMLPEWVQDDDTPRQIRMLKCPCCSYQTDPVSEHNRANPVESRNKNGYKRGWAQTL